VATRYVKKRIYGPGPTRKSRVQLARPGRAYREEFVRTVVAGDSALVSTQPPAPKVKDPLDLSERRSERAAARVVVEDAPADGPAGEGPDLALDVDVDEEQPSIEGLLSLDRDAVLAVAAERGVDVDEAWTVEQIVGAIVAQAGTDADGTDGPADGAAGEPPPGEPPADAAAEPAPSRGRRSKG
jgi:hypothetical protein